MTEEMIQSIATFSECNFSGTPVANPVDGLDQSTGISEIFRRAPALTWVTLFFIRKEAICRAAGKQKKKLRLVVEIGFEPIR